MLLFLVKFNGHYLLFTMKQHIFFCHSVGFSIDGNVSDSSLLSVGFSADHSVDSSVLACSNVSL